MKNRKEHSPAAGDAEVKGMVRDFKDVQLDYTFDADIMNGEPERVRLVKQIVAERLSDADRIIILLYADCQSYRKLGARLGCSHTTVARTINRIRSFILAEYEKMKANEHLH